MPYTPQPSAAVQVRMNIRLAPIMTYQTLVDILTEKIPYKKDEHRPYIAAFFEECSPKLIKAFLQEQGLDDTCLEKIYSDVKDDGGVLYGKEKWRNEF